MIRTSHCKDEVQRISSKFHELDLFYSIHSHPGNSSTIPSGFEDANSKNEKIYYTKSNDYISVTNIYNKFKEADKVFPTSYPDFYIYHPKTKQRIKYNPLNSNIQTRRIRQAKEILQK